MLLDIALHRIMENHQIILLLQMDGVRVQHGILILMHPMRVRLVLDTAFILNDCCKRGGC